MATPNVAYFPDRWQAEAGNDRAAEPYRSRTDLADARQPTPFKDVEVRDLYPDVAPSSSVLAAAIPLLDEAANRLSQALALLERDPFDADDHVNAVNGLLPELFACRRLGEGFATVVNSLWIALRNRSEPVNREQMVALLQAINALRSEPFLEFEKSLDFSDRLLAVGLPIFQRELDNIAELFDG
jgi:hypothetical protein